MTTHPTLEVIDCSITVSPRRLADATVTTAGKLRLPPVWNLDPAGY